MHSLLLICFTFNKWTYNSCHILEIVFCYHCFFTDLNNKSFQIQQKNNNKIRFSKWQVRKTFFSAQGWFIQEGRKRDRQMFLSLALTPCPSLFPPPPVIMTQLWLKDGVKQGFCKRIGQIKQNHGVMSLTSGPCGRIGHWRQPCRLSAGSACVWQERHHGRALHRLPMPPAGPGGPNIYKHALRLPGFSVLLKVSWFALSTNSFNRFMCEDTVWYFHLLTYC